jgi:hypothetical protein
VSDDLPTTGEFVCVYVWKSTGVRCTRAPVFGTSYCPRHSGKLGGKTAKKRQAAADKYVGLAEALLVEAGVEERVTILKDVRIVDPGITLMEEVARAKAVIAWLENRIGQMSEEELMHEPELLVIRERKRSTNPQGDNYTVRRTESRTTVSRYWKLLQEERRLLVNATTSALRSNIEERRVRIAERGVDALEQAMINALTRLGLDPQSDEVRAIVGAELSKALESGGAGSIFMGAGVVDMEPLAVESARNTVETPKGAQAPLAPPPAAPF